LFISDLLSDVTDFILEELAGLTLEELKVCLLRAIEGSDKAWRANVDGLRVVPKLGSMEVESSRLI